MSQLFIHCPLSFSVELQQQTGKASAVAQAWHPSLKLAAVAASDGTVHIFGENGTRVDQFSARFSEQSEVVSVVWHPSKFLICVGCSDGSVSLWSNIDRRLNSCSSAGFTHTGAITLLEFSPEGRRLISGDMQGDAIVWKLDSRGHVSGMWRYSLAKGPIRSICFRSPGNLSNIECPQFLLGCESGAVFQADDMNHCVLGFSMNQPLASLLYMESRQAVVAISRSSVMAVFRWELGSSAQKFGQILRVKINSSNEGVAEAFWITTGVLAYRSVHDSFIRIWDLHHEDNYAFQPSLTASDSSVTVTVSTSNVLAVAYHRKKMMMACALADGRIVFYSLTSSKKFDAPFWNFLGEAPLKDPCDSMQFSGMGTALSVISPGVPVIHMFVASELHRCVNPDGVCAVQVDASSVDLFNSWKTDAPLVLRLVESHPDFRIKGLSVNKSLLVVHSISTVCIVSLQSGEIVSSFDPLPKAGQLMCAKFHPTMEDSVMVLSESSKLDLFTIHGVFAGSLFASTAEAVDPVDELLVSLSGGVFATLSHGGLLKSYRLAGKEPKPCVAPKRLLASDADCVITKACISCDGSRIAYGKSAVPNVVFVFDLELDKVFEFVLDTASPGSWGVIDHISWDAEDPRIFAVSSSLRIVSILCFVPLCGISSLETRSMRVDSSSGVSVFLGVCAPFILVCGPFGLTLSDRLQRLLLRDFAGMPSFSPALTLEQIRTDASLAELKSSLLDLSAHLSCGNMDDAFRAVRKLPSSSSSIWVNMARMCVETRRMDVAELCVKRIGNAKMIASFCHQSFPSAEAKISALAMELGMIPEAVRILRDSQQWLTLIDLLASLGRWEEAIEIAEKFDRIHLRTLHFRHGQALEALGDLAGAIMAFEKAGAQASEVPRMLLAHDKLAMLKEYILVRRPGDKELKKWYAAYCEAAGDLSAAYKLYLEGDDVLSAVRVLCLQGQFDDAERLVDQRSDKAAAFFFARFVESSEDSDLVKRAIRAFASAGRHLQAVRLAIKSGQDHDLISIALSSPNRQPLFIAGQFFERRNEMDQAVVLHMKAGLVGRAIDICLRSHLFDTLQKIVEELLATQTNVNAGVLSRCADFFVSHGKLDKACQVLVAAREYEKALQICADRAVPLTEDLAEKIAFENKDDPRRLPVLARVAAIAAAQGNFQLATKKYTQAGDRIRAMQCLLQSGDIEKIIFFANVSKQKEIYMLAANHLQNLDWRSNPDILKHIVSLYTKAKATDALAFFFDSCAQVEVDDYRDYERSLEALRESAKYMTKSRVSGKDSKLEDISRRIARVEKFCDARKAVRTDPGAMIAMCNGLLEDMQADTARGLQGAEEGSSGSVRLGDVYALMVEYYHSVGALSEARQFVQKMVQRRIDLNYYLDPSMVQAVAPDLMKQDAAGGQTLPTGSPGAGSPFHARASRGQAEHAAGGGARSPATDDSEFDEVNGNFEEDLDVADD